MGPAHSTVKNHTERRICVITFTNSDLVYLSYNTLYVIEPGSSQLVESQPDPVGLKIGLVYDIDIEKKELLYQRFVCKTDSVLNIGELEYDEISWFGDNITGYTKGKLKETNITAFTMAKEAVDNVAPTVGKRNGKFEKELIKRVTTDYMEKHNIHINMNNSLKSGSSDMNLDQYNNNIDNNGNNTQPGSNSFYNKSKGGIEDEKSAAEKWTLQLEKLREAAAIKEAKLAESQALITERLARVAEEEAQAAELEKQKEEEKRLEEIRLKEIEKIRKEQEHDEVVKEKKGKKGKKKSKEKEKSSGGGCNIM